MQRITSETTDPFRFVHIELPATRDKTTLQECLENYTEEEDVDRRCDDPVCEINGAKWSYKSVHFKKNPEVLIIHLKRFGGQGEEGWKSKIETVVDFPDVLKLDKYTRPVDDQEEACSYEYKLYSTINHNGEQESGHYIAQCQDDTNPGHWHYYDEHETSSTHDHVEKENAYILFYKRVDQSADDAAEYIEKEMGARCETDNNAPPTNEQDIEDHMESLLKKKAKRLRRPSKKQIENDEVNKKPPLKGEGNGRIGEKGEVEEYNMICKCEDPYDETRPMLDCGRCLGWVHGECVPYTCKECEKTEKQGFFDEIKRLKAEGTKLSVANKLLKSQNKTLETAATIATKNLSKAEGSIAKLKLKNDKSDAAKEKNEEKLTEKGQQHKEEIEKLKNHHAKEIEQKTLEIQKGEQEIDLITRRLLVKQGEELEKQNTREEAMIAESQKEKGDAMVAESRKEKDGEDELEKKVENLEKEVSKYKEELNKQASEREKEQETEIEGLKEQIKKYDSRLEIALCELAKNERVTVHLCNKLDDMKILHKELEIALSQDEEHKTQKEDAFGSGNKKKMCRLIKRGKCTYGENCKFSHDQKTEVEEAGLGKVPSNENGLPKQNHSKESQDAADATKEKTGEELQSKASMLGPIKRPCRFFKSGRCRNGENCRFEHKLLEEKPIDLTEDEHKQLEKKSAGKTKDLAENKVGPDGNGGNPGRKAMPPCRFFKTGRCRNGENCRFEHGQLDKNGEEEALRAAEIKVRNENEEPTNHHRVIPCRFYRTGRCRKGPDCRFSHDQNNGTRSNEEDADKARPRTTNKNINKDARNQGKFGMYSHLESEACPKNCSEGEQKQELPLKLETALLRFLTEEANRWTQGQNPCQDQKMWLRKSDVGMATKMQ